MKFYSNVSLRYFCNGGIGHESYEIPLITIYALLG